jgi:hypothetical protein
MKRITFLLVAVAMLAGVVAFTAIASRHADDKGSPIFVTKIPPDTATGGSSPWPTKKQPQRYPRDSGQR